VTWSVVQSNSATTGGTASLAVTFSSNVTAGNKIIVASATSAGGAISTSTVKDGAANSWTKAGAVTNGNNEISLWYLDVPAGDAGTAPTMTATFSATCGASVIIQEVSGLATGNTAGAALDGTLATLTGSSASTGSPSYSTTASNEYLVSVLGDSGGGATVTAAGGWTLDAHSQNTNGNCNCLIEYKNSTGGAETNGFGAENVTWEIVEVAFLLPAAAGGAPPAAAARPGRTWLRRFHHRQQPQQVAAAVVAPVSGPPVARLAGPVRARVPQLFLKGRVTGSSDGTSATLGPPVTPLRGPVRPQLPLQPLRAGRTATMVALPLFYSGPPVTPLTGPVRARFPLPKRGRASGSQGAPAAAAPPQAAPAPPLRAPVRTRPQPPPRGRTAGNSGTRQQTGPPVAPLRGPVCARQPLPRRGRCQGNQGTFTQVVIVSGAPVYPIHGPVRIRPQLPPRGRCAGNRGVRHQAGPPVTPLRGPVAPFRPGPYRSGRTAGNAGTFNQAGPRVTPLRGPVLARRPGPYRSGRCLATFIYRPPAPPPAFQVARSSPTVADPRDGTATVAALATSAPAVTDPRDGTPGVT
jgi:hypothetical protein